MDGGLLDIFVTLIVGIILGYASHFLKERSKNKDLKIKSLSRVRAYKESFQQSLKSRSVAQINQEYFNERWRIKGYNKDDDYRELQKWEQRAFDLTEKSAIDREKLIISISELQFAIGSNVHEDKIRAAYETMELYMNFGAPKEKITEITDTVKWKDKMLKDLETNTLERYKAPLEDLISSVERHLFNSKEE